MQLVVAGIIYYLRNQREH